MTREELAALRDAIDAGLRVMATQGRRGAPYVTAVSVTAEPEADRIDRGPAAAHAPWLKPLSSYERRETTTVEGLRYG